jgi:hypothetical protein
MLKHHADAETAGFTRRGYRNRFAMPEDVAVRRFENAEQHLYQRGFAGTIFAQQSMYFAGSYIEVDFIAGNKATEKFRQLLNR